MIKVRLARDPQQCPEPARFRGSRHYLRPIVFYHRYLCTRVTQNFTFYVINNNINVLQRCNAHFNIVNIVWHRRLNAQFAVVENYLQNFFIIFKWKYISIVTTAVINPDHIRHTVSSHLHRRHVRVCLVRFCLRVARTIFQHMIGD